MSQCSVCKQVIVSPCVECKATMTKEWLNENCPGNSCPLYQSYLKHKEYAWKHRRK